MNVKQPLTTGIVRMICYLRKYPFMAAQLLFKKNSSPVDLAEYQKLILICMWVKLYPIINVTRGGGKTFIQAVHSLLSSLLYKGERVGLISASFRQAKLIFEECQSIVNDSSLLRQALFRGPTIKTDLAYIVWRHGSVINALPLGNGDKIRGARFHRIEADEYAQIPVDILDVVVIGFTATMLDPMKNVRRIEEEKRLVAEGTNTRTIRARENQVSAFSTAYYQYNHLWDTLQQRLVYMRSKFSKNPIEGHDQYIVLKIPHYLLPDGFLSKNAIQMAKQKMSSNEFNMEYCTKYPADSDGFFKMSTLDKAVSKRHTFKYKGIDNHEYVLGIDPARDNANCAFVVIQVGHEEESSTIVAIETLNNQSYGIIHERILEIISRYNISMILVDKGGGGSAIKDNLCDPDKMKSHPLIYDVDDDNSYINGTKTNPKSGRHMLRMINFSPSWIADANHSLLANLESKRLVFARDPIDVDLFEASETECIWMDKEAEEFEAAKQELSRIVVTVTTRGIPHWDTESKHDRKDRYSAILIANDAIKIIKIEKETMAERQIIAGGWVEDIDSNYADTQSSYFNIASL